MSPILAAATAQYSNLFVVLLGICTVFVGLISIIILCTITGLICRAFGKKQATGPSVIKAEKAPVASYTTVPCEIPNRGEFVAAVSSALAEELGTDVSSIRIHSIKKIVK